jgi:hypothetical protein
MQGNSNFKEYESEERSKIKLMQRMRCHEVINRICHIQNNIRLMLLNLNLNRLMKESSYTNLRLLTVPEIKVKGKRQSEGTNDEIVTHANPINQKHSIGYSVKHKYPNLYPKEVVECFVVIN